LSEHKLTEKLIEVLENEEDLTIKSQGETDTPAIQKE
jgi:hypothetical protein